MQLMNAIWGTFLNLFAFVVGIGLLALVAMALAHALVHFYGWLRKVWP